ncbi:MAG: helix-turn-helix transcriptional regulator [Pseudomonadota bacterium]
MSLISYQIGKRLRRLRGARSQREVAQLAGISPAQYSRYERGTVTPSDVVLVGLAVALGCEAEDIIGINEAIIRPTERDNGITYHYLGMAIGSRLSVLRRQASLSLEDVASRAGLPIERYSHFELGQDIPDDITIKALASVLDVDPIQIVGSASTADFLSDLLRSDQWLDIEYEGSFIKHNTRLAKQAYDQMDEVIDSALRRSEQLSQQITALIKENINLRKQLAELHAILEIGITKKLSLPEPVFTVGTNTSEPAKGDE